MRDHDDKESVLNDLNEWSRFPRGGGDLPRGAIRHRRVMGQDDANSRGAVGPIPSVVGGSCIIGVRCEPRILVVQILHEDVSDQGDGEGPVSRCIWSLCLPDCQSQ